MKISTCQILMLCMFLKLSSSSAEIERGNRVKRQNPGDAVIDAVFQIPIQTLSAVGTLVKTSRPIIMQVRQRIQQSLTPRGGHPHRFSFPALNSQQQTAQQQQAGNRISTASYIGTYQQQQPTAASYNRYQQATSTYNRLQQPTFNYNKLSQQPATSSNRHNQKPNASFNKLYKQPSRRPSSGSGKFKFSDE